MPPLRQPCPMALVAEQLLADMATEAGQGLVSTPGDPMHAAVISKLHVALRQLPEEAALRLSQTVLTAVDKALVFEELDRVTSEVLMLMSFCVAGPWPGHHDEVLAELASLAALSAPVDEDVAQALLATAAACLPDHFTKVDSTELSSAGTAAVVAQLSKMQRLESLRLTSPHGAGLLGGALYPLARALHCMPRLSVVSLAQSATDNVLRVLAQACPDTLEELDVSRSRAVTDKGVAALTACPNLRVLKLTRTSVTVLGAERALRGCPWLQSLGNIPDLGRAVAAAVRGGGGGGGGQSKDKDDGRERDELQLRSFRSDRPPPLAVVSEHCPRLEDITVHLSEDGDYYRIPSFSSFGDAVPGLSRLSLTCEESTGNDLVAELLDWPEEADDTNGAPEWNLPAEDVRWVTTSTARNKSCTRTRAGSSYTPSRHLLPRPTVDPYAAPASEPPPSVPPPRLDNLTELKLCGTPLAAWDMHVIGHVCPRLQHLTVMATPPSPSPRHERVFCPDRRMPEDAFLRLRFFQAEDLLPEAEFVVLSRAVALEEVYISHWDPGARRMSFGEDAFLDALQGNPLAQLGTFCVDEAPFLGERAARRLLECPLLKALATLRSWDHLGPGKLQQLQAEAEEQNLDLVIQ